MSRDDTPLTPPHNLEAEQAILGMMIFSNQAFVRGVAVLRPESFYPLQHQIIFRALVALSQSGKPPDLVLISDSLRETDQLEAAGGAGYVTELHKGAFSDATFDHYLEIVQRDARKRALVKLGLELQARAPNGELQGLVEKARRTLEKIDYEVASPSSSVMFTPASRVCIEVPAWLWVERIPVGAVTTLVGQPGLGKSTHALEVASRASRGQLLGNLHEEPVAVAIATAEDSPSTTVVPRLIAAGADLTRINFARVRRDDISGTIMFPDDITAIRAKMQEVGARLLIVDPLVAHLPGSVNSWRDQDVRRALAPLAGLADELRVAVIVIVHLNKRDSADVLSRVSGSIGIVAAARSVLLAATDPADSDGPTRVLAHVKSNLGPLAPTLRYRIEARAIDGPEGKMQTSGIVWMGEAPDVRASELLAPNTPEERSEREEAVEWLREALADGPRSAKGIFKEARSNGFSEKTLHRAKRGLGIRSVKTGFGKTGEWCWALSKDGQPGPLDGQYLRVGHLKQDAGLARASDAGPALDGHIPNIDHLSGRADHLRQTADGGQPPGDSPPEGSEARDVVPPTPAPLGLPPFDGLDRRMVVVRMGENLSWTRLEFKPGGAIQPGEECWWIFAEVAPIEDIGMALRALEGDVSNDDTHLRDSPAVDVRDRNHSLVSAAVAGWPSIPVRPGLRISAGEHGWRGFAATASDKDFASAMETLQAYYPTGTT